MPAQVFQKYSSSSGDIPQILFFFFLISSEITFSSLNLLSHNFSLVGYVIIWIYHLKALKKTTGLILDNALYLSIMLLLYNVNL